MTKLFQKYNTDAKYMRREILLAVKNGDLDPAQILACVFSHITDEQAREIADEHNFFNEEG